MTILGLGFLALALFAGLAGWLFFAASQPTPSGFALGPIWPYALGGTVLVGALMGFFMWLTFYSADHGYDDRAGGPSDDSDRNSAGDPERRG